jgi:hypothetical protein
VKAETADDLSKAHSTLAAAITIANPPPRVSPLGNPGSKMWGDWRLAYGERDNFRQSKVSRWPEAAHRAGECAA